MELWRIEHCHCHGAWSLLLLFMFYRCMRIEKFILKHLFTLPKGVRKGGAAVGGSRARELSAQSRKVER